MQVKESTMMMMLCLDWL